MKIKEGGGMDIQKEREAFDEWVAKHPDSLDLTRYEEDIMFDAWQAAKEVPEGFVLMPKEPTDEIIEAMNEFDYRNDYSDMDGAYRTIVETLEKAQEPTK